MNDIFAKDLSGALVSPDEPGYDALINDIFSCMETSQELNTVSIRDQKRVHELICTPALGAHTGHDLGTGSARLAS